MANVENVEAALRELRTEPLPAPLDAWRIEIGADWSGDPAVRVWIPIENVDSVDLDVDMLMTMHDAVRDRVRSAVDDDSLVYVHFDDPSEFGEAP